VIEALGGVKAVAELSGARAFACALMPLKLPCSPAPAHRRKAAHIEAY